MQTSVGIHGLSGYDHGMEHPPSERHDKPPRTTRWTRHFAIALPATALLLLTQGCAQNEQPLHDARFYNPPRVREPAEPVDHPGAVGMHNRPAEPSEPSVKEISPTVSQAVKSPADTSFSAADNGAAIASSQPATTQPATSRATSRPALGTGQYVTLGAVVAEVNGVPIYADKVLAWVQKDLAAKAREMDRETFRRYATQQLTRSRDYFVNNELIFAAAQRSLDKRERELADTLTTAWRTRKVTESGGSIELARRKANDEGTSFDEQVQEQYRTFMAQIYYQKKVMPRIQITAQDLRAYYLRHVQDEFTEHGQVRFRLIKIDPHDVGGRDAAIERVREIQDKAAKGFNFAELAKTYNRDPLLQRNDGDVGWVDQGAFRLEQVEQAVWKLQPGQVTQNFVEEDGAFYVAKLEERKLGRIAPFEDPSVQQAIQDKLRSEQFRTLQDRTMDALKRDAIIDLKNDNLNIILEMAMQRYPFWHES